SVSMRTHSRRGQSVISVWVSELSFWGNSRKSDIERLRLAPTVRPRTDCFALLLVFEAERDSPAQKRELDLVDAWRVVP
ncbi:MAG: hypothetical protein OXC29_18525, partial [Rhodococcus sp.]|nr:hypothetical protein [Rhodococcus sp. (in: high G+C Gram-positive bacteria)]